MRPSKRVVTLAVVACLAFAGLGLAAATSKAATCSIALGGDCGPYHSTAIPMSNGYDTYVANQNVGATSGTTETLTATDASNWSLTANAQPYGYTGVQTFPDVQQLTNDWCGNGWGGCTNPSDTPLGSLSALSVKYAEASPTDANSIYEFAPDVWTNYNSDIMFWVDTHGRCDAGAFGGTTLGTFTMDGQNWTAHRYGDAGAEIILVLDGPGGSGTCAEQSSGTIDIKGGLNWLAGKGYIPSPVTISQLNTGWEITSSDNQQFTVSDYSITATVSGSAPSPSPSTSSPAPSPSTSSAAPSPSTSSPSPSPSTSSPAPGPSTSSAAPSPSTSSPAPSPSTSSPAPTPTPTQTSTAPAPSGLSHSSHVLVDFWWGSVTGATGYEFELVTFTGSVVDDETVTSPHVSNVEVTTNTKYRWRVRATGGNWSTWKSFTSP